MVGRKPQGREGCGAKSEALLAVTWRVRLPRGDQGPWEGVQRTTCLCTQILKKWDPHTAFQVLSLFIEEVPFPERNPLKRCLQLVGGQKQQQKAFFGLFGFCSQVSFLYQKLWHFSSRLQREGRMLSPAHICSPGGSGCSPGPLHNYRHQAGSPTSAPGAGCHVSSSETLPKKHHISRSQGNCVGVTGTFPTSLPLQHSMLLPIASWCLLALMHGKCGHKLGVTPHWGPLKAAIGDPWTVLILSQSLTGKREHASRTPSFFALDGINPIW